MVRGIRHSAAQRHRVVTAYRASSQIQFSKDQGISTTRLGFAVAMGDGDLDAEVVVGMSGQRRDGLDETGAALVFDVD